MLQRLSVNKQTSLVLTSYKNNYKDYQVRLKQLTIYFKVHGRGKHRTKKIYFRTKKSSHTTMSKLHAPVFEHVVCSLVFTP